ncbi:ribonuclease HII [Patescibacteria group bacterium]
MIKSTFDLENKLMGGEYKFIIGIDEAGRGPLAGPVVASAAAYKSLGSLASKYAEFQESFDLIRDSKTLSEKQREKIFDFIMDNFHVGIGICDHETVDRMNILEASFLSMKKALTALTKNLEPATSNLRSIVLIDGNKKIPNFSAEQKAVVGGDKIIKSISAASIVAKVTRDRIMKEMHEKYPVYGFDRHKGYGTKFHVDSLQKHGPCEIHRKSFGPVKNLAKKNN